MPTANAEGPCRSEGTQGRVSPRPFFPTPPPSAFAVGVPQDFAKKKRPALGPDAVPFGHYARPAYPCEPSQSPVQLWAAQQAKKRPHAETGSSDAPSVPSNVPVRIAAIVIAHTA